LKRIGKSGDIPAILPLVPVYAADKARRKAGFFMLAAPLPATKSCIFPIFFLYYDKRAWG